MSIIQGISQTAAGGFDPELIGNSVWLDGSADLFKRTFSSASNQKRFILGTWIQRNSISSGTLQTIFATGADGSNGFFFQYQNATSSRDDRINIYNISGGSIDWNIQTSARFRDIAYYHILLSYESAASQTSRVQLHINGVLQTSLETASYPALNFDCDWGSAQSHCIANNDHNTSAPLPAYLAQTIYLDGQSIQNGDVAVTDFLDSFAYGDSGSQFGPRADTDIAALASSAGGNSFCLSFENSILLGQDISDNSETNVARSMTGLKSDDLDVGAASLLTDGTQFGSWNAGSNLVYQNSNTTTKAWWGVDFGADGVAITKAILYGNQSSDGSTAGFTSTSISNVTFTLFGSDSAQATNNNDLSGLTTVGSVVVSNTQTKGVTATISASSNTTKFRYYYVQMNTTESTRRLLGEIELFTVGNSFSATSMSAANQSTNTPSLVFSTYNILDANAAYTSADDGANTYVVTNVGGAGMRSTIPMTSGKWYWEQRNGGSNECGPAVSAGSGFVNLATNSIIGEGSGSHSVYLNYQGYVRINASTGSSIGVTNGTTAVMGVAFDADTGKVWFRDSSGFGSSGDPANGTGEHATLATTSAPFFIAARVGGAVAEPFLNAGGNGTFNGLETAGNNADANGYGNFKLGAVPSGFLALCSANLPTPDAQGVDHFATTLAQEGSLFSGMGTAESAYSATLRIYKSRASASASETWGYSFSHDSSNEYILPAANTAMTYGSLRSLSGTDNWVGYSLNISATAGTAAGSQAHSNGSDTTVTHSLGSSRYIVLLFSRSGGDIFFYHPDVAAGSLLKLNSNVLPFSSTVITDITTNSFDIGSAAGSATYDYLVLAETPGVTDIFSYIGNGSTDGPYLSLNAMPEFLTFKLTTTHATEHIVLDQTRSPINDADIPYIMPNQLSAETNNTTFLTDFLSGAAKIRNSSTDGNFSGGTFVGWSFGKIAGGGTLPPVYGK